MFSEGKLYFCHKNGLSNVFLLNGRVFVSYQAGWTSTNKHAKQQNDPAIDGLVHETQLPHFQALKTYYIARNWKMNSIQYNNRNMSKN